MQVREYIEIVERTDQFSDYDVDKRRQISLYGLVGEIGSLTSAVKKVMLAEYVSSSNDEVVEEIGDAFWYLFNLATILGINETQDVLKRNIARIRNEVTERSERGQAIRGALETLDGERLAAFDKAAGEFLALEDVTFDSYQKTAYLTARTKGHVLNDVCLAMLWQLGAELLRQFTMPRFERSLNKDLGLREPETIVDAIAWYLATIASVHKISLDQVVTVNVGKAKFRSRTQEAVPYYDEQFPANERLPRRFRIDFVSISPKHARMYYRGRPLGDDLTDNTYEEDGYRFHDVMHLANAACLRWSPVMRKLLKRKRKSSDKTDEVEDGARAEIVEELVVKAIHAEGKRLLPIDQRNVGRLFPEKGHITFGLIKTVHEYVKGLEVEESQEWEWRKAIFEGYRVYQMLREEGQGSVTVDLVDRSLCFDQRLHIGMGGVVRELGGSTAVIGETELPSCWITEQEILDNADPSSQAEVIAAKKGIMNALGLSEREGKSLREEISLSRMELGVLSVKAVGKVQEFMWGKRIIEFKFSFNHVNDMVVCTVLGLGDPKDALS